MTTDSARQRSERAADHAHRLISQGSVEDAVAILAAEAEKPDAHPGIWHNLGDAWVLAGRPDRAIKAFTSGIERGYPSEVNRGLAYESLGEASSARADYSAAITRDPNDIDALINLGTLELREGRTDSAARPLHAAAKLDPKANWQLADYYLAIEDVPLAIEALNEAIAAGESRAHLDRALALADAEPSANVDGDFLAAIVAGAPSARSEFVVYLDEHGRREEAFALAKQGIALGDALCYAPAAVIAEELGDTDAAIAWYQAAVQAGDVNYASDLEALLERKLEED